MTTDESTPPDQVELDADPGLGSDADVAPAPDVGPSADLGDDATLPAAGDVVAQIRAHAAQVRVEAEETQAQADPDQVVVWTSPVTDAEPSHVVPGPAPDVLDELVDPTVPFRPPAKDGTQGPSLIDGQAPPQAATTFWGPNDNVFRASGIDEQPRRSLSTRSLPLWALLAAVIVAIVLTSVGLAVLVATGVPT